MICDAGILWKSFAQMLQTELALHVQSPWASADITAAAQSLLAGTLGLLQASDASIDPDHTAWAKLTEGLILLVKEACGAQALKLASATMIDRTGM